MLLTFYFKDGRQYPFTIADGQSSTEFLKTVKTWEIFDQPILRVHDRRDTWAFNPTAIEKIHFMTTEDPGWKPAENVLSAKCLAPESSQRKMAAKEAGKQKAEQSYEEGQFFESMLRITLASGAVDTFECLLMLRSRREQQMNLYHLFQKVAYPIACESGGFVLLNPANIVCIHMHPSPPETPDSAWLVDAYAGRDSGDLALAAEPVRS